MSDVLTKSQRSYCMSRIRDKDTQPELLLRKAIWAAGIRGYRVHYRLTGNPDVVFPRTRIAVFVDGCFWHKCPKCFIKPATNWRFWKKKIDSNVKRDQVVNAELRKKGWRVIRFWEHQVRRNAQACAARVQREYRKRIVDG